MGNAQDQDLRGEERTTAGPPKWSSNPAPPPPHSNRADPDDIKRDIDHTRAEMDETIDALSARLQPRILLDEAMSWVGIGGHASCPPGSNRPSDRVAVIKTELRAKARSAAKTCAKSSGRYMWQTIRRHPLPSLMIGAGIVWLLLEEGRKPGRRSLRKYTYTPDPEYSGSYVDARTGKPYHSETYNRDVSQEQPGRRQFTDSLGDVRSPEQFTDAHDAGRETRLPEEQLAAEERRPDLHPEADTRSTPRPQPDPIHSGSYVDARTGNAYDEERYGEDRSETASRKENA